jgi:protein-S-isoprenylcysteine O-methyltransferase Ste14
MNLALIRTEAQYRFRAESAPPAARRDYRELASKVCILTLFSAMASSLVREAAVTGHVTGILLLTSEALVVALTLVRRTAGVVDRSWQARALTMLSTFGPPLVRPASPAMAPEALTVIVSGIGLIIVVLGKLSLGRSFGLTPANRGIVSTGLYRFLRHPIYLGYLITHVGFFMAHAGPWNLVVLLAADTALMVRAVYEEKTLALDPAYRTYMSRARWRVLPGLF